MSCRHIWILITLLSPLVATAAKVEKIADDSIYLDCTGSRPFWTKTWSDLPQAVGNDKAKLVIKLNVISHTAVVAGLFDGDDYVFQIKSQPEWYYGSGTRDVAFLDGQVTNAYISLNRINGSAHIGFEVVASPSNGKRFAFSGSCERGAVKF